MYLSVKGKDYLIITDWLRKEHPEVSKKICFVCDNHSAHYSPTTISLIKSLGNCEILYLPIHSSALNPIEKVWAIFKYKLRKHLA